MKITEGVTILLKNIYTASYVTYKKLCRIILGKENDNNFKRRVKNVENHKVWLEVKKTNTSRKIITTRLIREWKFNSNSRESEFKKI